MQTECKMQTADCRLRVKRRLGAKCRIKTVDFLNICAGISYTPRFLVEVHCTFAKSFNEHPNSLSLRTLICNTFIEGHPNLLQNIFPCCWNDFLPFYRHNSFCTVFWVSSFYLERKHRRVVPIHSHMYQKLSV